MRGIGAEIEAARLERKLDALVANGRAQVAAIERQTAMLQVLISTMQTLIAAATPAKPATSRPVRRKVGR